MTLFVIPLREALKQKDTNKVLNYIKDNNLSVDVMIEDGTTPLMYSSFYDDENTSKALINLGANPHQKDRYGLSPMAYAISMNSLKVVKLLYDSGVKFEEAPITQGYILPPSYSNIDKLIIDENNVEIIYKYNYIQKDYDTPKGGGYMFEDVVYKNWLEMAKFMLDSGYKPYTYFSTGGDSMVYGNSIFDIFSQKDIDSEIEYAKKNNKDTFNQELFMDRFSYSHTLYKRIEDVPNHEQMLDLLLEHNISGQPSKEFLRSEYERCYRDYVWTVGRYLYFLYFSLKGIDREKEKELIAKYSKKSKYKEYVGDISLMTEVLIRDGIIVRIPQEPDEKKVKFYKDEMDYYKKHCVEDKEFVVESLLHLNSSSPFEKLSKFEKTKPDENVSFKGTREYINYKNASNKKYAIDWFIDGHPAKVYLKDKNMTLKEFQDIEYKKYLNENRGKNGKKLK